MALTLVQRDCMDHEGAVALAKALETNSSLTTLKLGVWRSRQGTSYVGSAGSRC